MLCYLYLSLVSYKSAYHFFDLNMGVLNFPRGSCTKGVTFGQVVGLHYCWCLFFIIFLNLFVTSIFKYNILYLIHINIINYIKLKFFSNIYYFVKCILKN